MPAIFEHDTTKVDMIVKRVSVPVGLEELMEGLTKEVLLKKPKDLYLFASEYFSRLIILRQHSSNHKACPIRTVQSVTKVTPQTKKILPASHLSRQASNRTKSPVLSKESQVKPLKGRSETSKERPLDVQKKKKLSLPSQVTPKDQRQTPRSFRSSSTDPQKGVKKVKVRPERKATSFVGRDVRAASSKAVLDSDLLAASTNLQLKQEGTEARALKSSEDSGKGSLAQESAESETPAATSGPLTEYNVQTTEVNSIEAEDGSVKHEEPSHVKPKSASEDSEEQTAPVAADESNKASNEEDTSFAELEGKRTSFEVPLGLDFKEKFVDIQMKPTSGSDDVLIVSISDDPAQESKADPAESGDVSKQATFFRDSEGLVSEQSDAIVVDATSSDPTKALLNTFIHNEQLQVFHSGEPLIVATVLTTSVLNNEGMRTSERADEHFKAVSSPKNSAAENEAALLNNFLSHEQLNVFQPTALVLQSDMKIMEQSWRSSSSSSTETREHTLPKQDSLMMFNSVKELLDLDANRTLVGIKESRSESTDKESESNSLKLIIADGDESETTATMATERGKKAATTEDVEALFEEPKTDNNLNNSKTNGEARTTEELDDGGANETTSQIFIGPDKPKPLKEQQSLEAQTFTRTQLVDNRDAEAPIKEIRQVETLKDAKVADNHLVDRQEVQSSLNSSREATSTLSNQIPNVKRHPKIGEIDQVASVIEVVKHICSDKIPVDEIRLTAVTSYLNSFLEKEQNHVFLPHTVGKPRGPANGKQRLKRSVKDKGERPVSQTNLLNDRNASRQFRRAKSVGLIKTPDLEFKSKIPTSARRSAGRRPLVRQLEADSKELEEKLDFKRCNSKVDLKSDAPRPKNGLVDSVDGALKAAAVLKDVQNQSKDDGTLTQLDVEASPDTNTNVLAVKQLLDQLATSEAPHGVQEDKPISAEAFESSGGATAAPPRVPAEDATVSTQKEATEDIITAKSVDEGTTKVEEKNPELFTEGLSENAEERIKTEVKIPGNESIKNQPRRSSKEVVDPELKNQPKDTHHDTFGSDPKSEDQHEGKSNYTKEADFKNQVEVVRDDQQSLLPPELQSEKKSKERNEATLKGFVEADKRPAESTSVDSGQSEGKEEDKKVSELQYDAEQGTKHCMEVAEHETKNKPEELSAALVKHSQRSNGIVEIQNEDPSKGDSKVESAGILESHVEAEESNTKLNIDFSKQASTVEPRQGKGEDTSREHDREQNKNFQHLETASSAVGQSNERIALVAKDENNLQIVEDPKERPEVFRSPSADKSKEGTEAISEETVKIEGQLANSSSDVIDDLSERQSKESKENSVAEQESQVNRCNGVPLQPKNAKAIENKPGEDKEPILEGQSVAEQGEKLTSEVPKYQIEEATKEGHAKPKIEILERDNAEPHKEGAKEAGLENQNVVEEDERLIIESKDAVLELHEEHTKGSNDVPRQQISESIEAESKQLSMNSNLDGQDENLFKDASLEDPKKSDKDANKFTNLVTTEDFAEAKSLTNSSYAVLGHENDKSPKESNELVLSNALKAEEQDVKNSIRVLEPESLVPGVRILKETKEPQLEAKCAETQKDSSESSVGVEAQRPKTSFEAYKTPEQSEATSNDHVVVDDTDHEAKAKSEAHVDEENRSNNIALENSDDMEAEQLQLNKQIDVVDHDKEKKAATKIQAAWKGFVSRKMMNRTEVKHKENQAAAVKIQAVLRGFLGRLRYQKLKVAHAEREDLVADNDDKEKLLLDSNELGAKNDSNSGMSMNEVKHVDRPEHKKETPRDDSGEKIDKAAPKPIDIIDIEGVSDKLIKNDVGPRLKEDISSTENKAEVKLNAADRAEEKTVSTKSEPNSCSSAEETSISKEEAEANKLTSPSPTESNLRAKPDFYRSDTVVEEPLTKKTVSSLNADQTQQELSLNKDANNNSSKDRTELERDVRAAVEGILSEAPTPLLEKEIMQNGTSEELGNVDDILDKLPQVPTEEITEDDAGRARSANAGLLVDDMSSVGSADSVVTVVMKPKSAENDTTNRRLNQDKKFPNRSLSTSALEDRVEFIDHVQNSLLDQLSGKRVDSFEIDHLQRELHDVATMYTSLEDNPPSPHSVEYLYDFEPEEEENMYDAGTARTPLRELPDIAEETETKEDDTRPKGDFCGTVNLQSCSQPLKGDVDIIAFNALKLSQSVLIDEKVAETDMSEVHDLESAPVNERLDEEKAGAANLHHTSEGQDSVLAANKRLDEKMGEGANLRHTNEVLLSVNERLKEQEKMFDSPSLKHTSELHDSVLPVNIRLDEEMAGDANLNYASEVQDSVDKRLDDKMGESASLKHTSEFHDTVVVPLPHGADVKITNASKELLLEGPNRTSTMDSGNQTVQQAPAGAPVVTSGRSWQDGVAGAQASLKDTASAKPRSDGADSNQSPPQSSRFANQDMESGLRNKTRNNAINNNNSTEKSMETQAATKIQAGFRGYQVRKQIKAKNAAIDQKRQLRKRSSREDMKEPGLEEKSAVKIQAGVRGFLVRRRQKKVNSSASA